MKEKNNKTNKNTKATQNKPKNTHTKQNKTTTRFPRCLVRVLSFQCLAVMSPGTTTLHLATKYDDKPEPIVYPTPSKKASKEIVCF